MAGPKAPLKAADTAAFDPELNVRPLAAPARLIVGALLVALSLFHYYTAGFGLFREATHRGLHLAAVLALIFLVHGARRGVVPSQAVIAWHRPGGVPLMDWLGAILAAIVALYIPIVFDDLAFRIGNPLPIDIIAGSLMIVLVLETTRRAVGPSLPIIAVLFMVYALAGPSMPGLLVHPGTSWSGLVNHLYLTSQGIYGIPVGVVATYVFHFVLFGVLANRIGLGQLFIDLASAIAGRYTGGPAKVAVLASGLLGTISGSSIANAVTTGSLTIPAMKRLGYPAHFAAGVEATASAGGQITPPIMGAAAFIMVEFLEIPYREILIAALIPALMHYLGVFTMVHLEARRLGLRGLAPDELPRIWSLIAKKGLVLLPLLAVIALIMVGHTPYLAAFWGITGCIVVGFLNPKGRLTLSALIEALQLGAKYALGIGAAAATVGIVVGVVSLTGLGFKLSFVITMLAADWSEAVSAWLPAGFIIPGELTLFFTLLLTAITCVVMGAGIPTTATYIILVTVAAPALGLLGVEPLVAHFFVFYFGVLADVTPPVALAAYAAAAIAGADPFKTGNVAFRLAAAKALVPFVFAYAPVMLIVGGDFAWMPFLAVTLGCIAGIICLGIALTGYLIHGLKPWERGLAGMAALLLVTPSTAASFAGAALMVPILSLQIIQARRDRTLSSVGD